MIAPADTPPRATHGDGHAAFLTSVQLRERGWTAGLIRRFLALPDRQAPNPVFKSAAPMSLYAVARVEAVEASPEFAAARTRAAMRSVASRRAATTKAERLLARIAALPITVRRHDLAVVRARACNAYNAHQTDRLEWCDVIQRSADPVHSDPLFLERIMVNHIRHHLTIYDTALEEVAGKTGVQAASRLLRERIYAAIAATYPELAAECARQQQRRAQEEQP